MGSGRETHLVYIPALSLTGFGCLGLESLLCIMGTVITRVSQGHCENPIAEQELKNNGFWRLSPGRPLLADPGRFTYSLPLLSSFVKWGISSDFLRVTLWTKWEAARKELKGRPGT